ncbi:hypothetical protein FB157_114215 [Streptomyces sp. BK340]|nr:hypothetical protein FB157_114215 [Streptomyces sp. BK340]
MPRARGLVLLLSRTTRRVTRTYGGTCPATSPEPGCRSSRTGMRARTESPHRARPRSETARVRGNGPGTRKRGVHEHGSAPRPRTATPDESASRPHPRTPVTGHPRNGTDGRTAGTDGRPRTGRVPDHFRRACAGPGRTGLRGSRRGALRLRTPRRAGCARTGTGGGTVRPPGTGCRRGPRPVRRLPAHRRTRGSRPGEPAAAPRLGPLPRHPAERGPAPRHGTEHGPQGTRRTGRHHHAAPPGSTCGVPDGDDDPAPPAGGRAAAPRPCGRAARRPPGRVRARRPSRFAVRGSSGRVCSGWCGFRVRGVRRWPGWVRSRPSGFCVRAVCRSSGGVCSGWCGFRVRGVRRWPGWVRSRPSGFRGHAVHGSSGGGRSRSSGFRGKAGRRPCGLRAGPCRRPPDLPAAAPQASGA